MARPKTSKNPPAKPTPPLKVLDHPYVAHLLAQARDRRTGSEQFRALLEQIGLLLAYEAARDLPYHPQTIDTPLETMAGPCLTGPITIVPILRAGLGLAQGVARLFPQAAIGHIGLFRNEDNLHPVRYYDKLPATISSGTVFLVDPMLATGGSAVAAATMLYQRGCRDLRLLCAVAAPEGIKKVHSEHPELPIYAAALDRELDDRGYILPGLGDAGDRLFGTG